MFALEEPRSVSGDTAKHQRIGINNVPETIDMFCTGDVSGGHVVVFKPGLNIVCLPFRVSGKPKSYRGLQRSVKNFRVTIEWEKLSTLSAVR